MYQNNKKTFILPLTGVMILLFASQAMSQTKVLGLFQLGKSTYDEVKAKLPEGANAPHYRSTAGDYGGPAIKTDGKGYGIDGLKGVQFCFDKKQILSLLFMRLEECRFNDIKKIFSSKYRSIRSQYPDTYLLFKANRDYIYLYLPRDKEIGFGVDYMTDTVYHREKLEERQTLEYNKKYERENKKALEQEASKF